jgi:hypothetical protein
MSTTGSGDLISPLSGKKVVLGTCRLCLRDGQVLQRSHLMPRFCYRAIKRSGAGSNPVLVNRRTAVQTSDQEWTHLLCADCEKRFSDNGERYAAANFSNGKTFPLLDILQAATSTIRGPFRAYSELVTPTIKRESIAYFAMSVFWRYSLRTAVGDPTEQDTDLGIYNEPVRQYLLGQSPFPKHITLWSIACTDILSQTIIIPPTRISMPCLPKWKYSLHVPGMAFILMVGKESSLVPRTLCMVTSPERWLLTVDTSDKVISAMTLVMRDHRTRKVFN